MTDQQQRTQWALDPLDLFREFIRTWTPLATQSTLTDDGYSNAGSMLREAIKAIAPKDDGKAHVGWAVFKRERDTDYDRERPSGWVHTQVGAVFETMTQVGNVHQSCQKKDPKGHYLICEIREIP